MKNYIRPSVKINRFDVEDVIMASGGGVYGTYSNTQATADVVTTQVYRDYLNTEGNSGAAGGYVEFQW